MVLLRSIAVGLACLPLADNKLMELLGAVQCGAVYGAIYIPSGIYNAKTFRIKRNVFYQYSMYRDAMASRWDSYNLPIDRGWGPVNMNSASECIVKWGNFERFSACVARAEIYLHWNYRLLRLLIEIHLKLR